MVSGRKELAEYMQELSELSTTNKITADFDGIVQDVNVTASSTSGSSGSSSGNSSSGNSVSAVPTSASGVICDDIIENSDFRIGSKYCRPVKTVQKHLLAWYGARRL